MDAPINMALSTDLLINRKYDFIKLYDCIQTLSRF